MMEKDKYTATVNSHFEFETNPAQLDIVKAGDGTYHLLHNNKSYKAKIVSTDFEQKSITLEINGNSYSIVLSDKFDLLVKQLGLSKKTTQKINNIKAPMPGLVLDIPVEIGQSVAKEEGLIILEAMKMENVIKAAGEGVVKAIHVEKGTAVEKGQLLIEMD